MRTIDAIRHDVDHAYSMKDARALLRYADELDTIASMEAEALSGRARGEAHVIMGDFSTALEHLERVLPQFEVLSDQVNIATLLGDIGKVHLHTGNYPLALDHFQRSHEMHSAIGNRSGMAVSASNIGVVYDLSGDYQTALEFYHRSLTIHTEIDNLIGVSAAHSNIGALYSSLGEYPLSLEHHRRALAIDQEIGNESGIALITGNIGGVFLNTGEYSTALDQMYSALVMLEKLNDRPGIANVTGLIGNIYAETGNFDKALDYFQSALGINEEIGARSFSARNLFNIALVHCRLENYATALEFIQRSLTIHTELGDQNSIERVKANLIGIHLALGSVAEAKSLLDSIESFSNVEPDVVAAKESNRARIQEIEGDLEASADSLKRALAVADAHGHRYHAAEIHKGLRELALKRNDLAGYVEHNDAFTRITEEINGKETATRLAMQAKQREIDAREQEHAQYMAVLHSTLPQHIASRVAKGEVVNDQFEAAAVLFLDIVDFTRVSAMLTSNEVIHFLDTIFTALDAVCKKHNLVKIKTIGDSYMAVAFPTESSSSEQRVASIEERAANAALGMLHAVSDVVIPEGSPERSHVSVRIGLHCGALTAGVIGTDRLQYDVWGDTVNVASRMESTGEPGRIHVSEAFANALAPLELERGSERSERGEVSSDTSPPSPLSSLRGGTNIDRDKGGDVIPNEERNEEPGTWHLVLRGETEIKGKGTMTTYWLERIGRT
jgi:class 3 adenylate cyclase/Tfp pilus assembly protein PilF